VVVAPIILVKAKRKFEKILHTEMMFVNSLPSLVRKAGSRYYPIKISVRERLCEMSFLVVFVAWEEFLEFTFEQYVALGLRRTSLIRPKIQVDNLTTARDLIRGERFRPYVEWSDPEQIRRRAKIFFKDGEPYESALATALIHLKRMRTIRNHSVHHSTHVSNQFKTMIREIYGSGREITPGAFLLEPPAPGAMPIGSGVGYTSCFELFSEILSAMCGKIVP
jgi:hypothetical protein